MRAILFASFSLIIVSANQAFAEDGAVARLKAIQAIYGNVSPEEVGKLMKRDALAANAKETPAKPVSKKPITPQAKPVPLQNSYITTVLLIRDVYSTVAFISDDSELSSKGASFSYTSDRIADERTLAGKGAVFLAMYGDVNTNLRNADPNVNRLTAFSFVPGFEWDITAKKGSDPTGSYAARIGVELEFQGAPITAQYIRANAIYTTDVETSAARIYGAVVAWQPVIAGFINDSRQVNRALKMMVGFYPTLNFDYFYAGETAKFDNLVKGQDYFWVGPKLLGSIYFRKGSPLHAFSLTGEYFYLYDTINGSNTTVDYARGTANLKLFDWTSEVDPTQTASLGLTMRYTKGKTPRTLERVDELHSGITLSVGALPKAAAKD